MTTSSIHRAKRWNIVLVETYIKALGGERAVLSLCTGPQQKCCLNVKLVTVQRTNFSVAIKFLGHEKYAFSFLHNIWKIWIATKQISCLAASNFQIGFYFCLCDDNTYLCPRNSGKNLRNFFSFNVFHLIIDASNIKDNQANHATNSMCKFWMWSACQTWVQHAARSHIYDFNVRKTYKYF
jgi:hypothetical protein